MLKCKILLDNLRKKKWHAYQSQPPKSVDISPNIHYNLGKNRGAWEKGDGGSDERI